MPSQLIQCPRTHRRFRGKDEYVAHLRGMVQALRSSARGWKAYRTLRPSLLRLKRDSFGPEELCAWIVNNQRDLGVMSGTTTMSHSERDLFSGIYRPAVGDKRIARCQVDSVSLCQSEIYQSYSNRPYLAADIEFSLFTSTRPRYAQAFQALGIGNPCEARAWDRRDEPLRITYGLEVNLLEWPALAAQCVWQTSSDSSAAEPAFFSTMFPGIAWATLRVLTDSGFVPQTLTPFCHWLVQFNPRHAIMAPELPADLRL